MRQLDFVIHTWGGRRSGAGRKPTPGRRRGVPHRQRPAHDVRCPAHATLRVQAGMSSLRGTRVFPAVRGAIAAASRDHFRVLQFSVQTDHLHLVVEADAPTGLARGLQGLAIRVAKAVNRALGRRGTVFGDRYHAHALSTPREVRNALVYVLNNGRKHGLRAPGIDPCSSAAWFEGWRVHAPLSGPRPVAAPRTWLAGVGWRRHGLIDLHETPRSRGRSRARSETRTRTDDPP